MKKHIIVVFLATLVSLCLSGCSGKFTEKPLTKAGYTIENLSVSLPGVTTEQKLLLLADLHLLIPSDEVDPAYADTMTDRLNLFTVQGYYPASSKLWEELPGLLDKCNADYLLFAGDLVDFCSEANLSALKAGTDTLSTPFMYIRGDHDSSPYYMINQDKAACVERQNSISDNRDAFYRDFGEFIILGINNSTENITAEALLTVKEACNLGKPVIMLTHVPIAPLNDDSLANLSMEAKGGKVLLWQYEGGYYYPNEYTREFLSIVYSADSPIKEILCGHLHVSWDGYITENTHEHVFIPAFTKSVGVLKISGK